MYTSTISQPHEAGHDSTRAGIVSRWIALAAMLVAALVWTYWLVIPGLVAQWWDEPEYSHGFLVPLISGYLVWAKRDVLRQTPVAPGYSGLALMAFALLTYITGNVGADLFLQRVSLVMMIAGGILFIAGRAMLQALLFPIGFLLLMIPLPGIVFNSIAFPLQLFAAQVASSVMESCAVPVFREGNVMHLASASLDVEEACSGIRSLVSLTTLGVLFSYITYTTWLPRIILMLAVVPIAIAANVFRVTITGLIAHYVSVDAAMSIFHTAGGLGVFAIAAVLLLGVSRLLRLSGLAR
jgi:exosortase